MQKHIYVSGNRTTIKTDLDGWMAVEALAHESKVLPTVWAGAVITNAEQKIGKLKNRSGFLREFCFRVLVGKLWSSQRETLVTAEEIERQIRSNA